MHKWRWFFAGAAAVSLLGGSVVVAGPSGVPIVATLQRIEEKLDLLLKSDAELRQVIEGTAIRRADGVPRMLISTEDDE